LQLQFGLQYDRLQHELLLELQDGQSGLQHDMLHHEQLLDPKHGLQHGTSGHEQSKQHGLLQLGKQWQEQQNHATSEIAEIQYEKEQIMSYIVPM
jgi:hypothetical protein